MHDIAGYMLCSLELNMQALFMYTYVCVYVYFWFVSECMCACVYVLSGIYCPCPLHPYVCGCVLLCVSTVACLEAAEL